MSTFGISQNFRATSVVGRFGRTVAPEPEKVVVEDEDDYDDDYDSEEDEDEDEDDSKKSKDSKSSKSSKSSKASVAVSATSKKSDERVSCSTQFGSFMNRYAEKTADHH
jgi:hypothetical protein